jgi:hypothetical protein
VTDDKSVLDEAMDNLKEAAQRSRATQHALRASDLNESPNYKELSYRMSAALASRRLLS